MSDVSSLHQTSKSVGYESGNFIILPGFLDLNFPSHFGAKGFSDLEARKFQETKTNLPLPHS